MADIADRAEIEVQRQLDRSLKARIKPTGQSLTHCKECQNDIPILRQQTIKGVALCVECQQILERYIGLHPNAK